MNRVVNLSHRAYNYTKKGMLALSRGLGKTGFMDSMNEATKLDGTKVLAAIGVGSIVAKDGLGCYMYVNQSLKNKDIPDDKRKFVAALDLANGGLMILFQIAMFASITNKKFQKRVFDQFFGKHFNRDATKAYRSAMNSDKNFKAMTGKLFYAAQRNVNKKSASTLGYMTAQIGRASCRERV